MMASVLKEGFKEISEAYRQFYYTPCLLGMLK
jgi:hypothetical protein